MKYQAYSEYVDSNISSTPKIPSHWIVGKVKYVTESLDKIRVPLSAEERGGRQGDYPYYGASGIIDHVDDYLFNEDTILFGEDGANLIARSSPLAFLAKGKYWVNNHAHILKTKDGVNDYWVMCLENIDVTTVVSGAAQPKLTAEALGDLQIVYPSSILERKQIANFLDHETAKIDILIEKQQQLIKLLKEKRQAVISHAVTKGLNPNAPMRDSGVEWLGEVPDHWGVCKLKHIVSSLESGVSVNAADIPAQGDELGILKTSCVYTRSFRFEENKTIVKDEYDRVKCPVRKGAIIISRMNTPELVGASALVEIEQPNIFLPDRLWQTVFSDDTQLNPVFISFFMMIEGFRNQISLAAEGASSSMQNIAKDDYLSINIAFPDINEQNTIARYLKNRLSSLKNLEGRANEAIDLIQERRTALISAAVTGKIDVRNWQTPNQASKEAIA